MLLISTVHHKANNTETPVALSFVCPIHDAVAAHGAQVCVNIPTALACEPESELPVALTSSPRSCYEGPCNCSRMAVKGLRGLQQSSGNCSGLQIARRPAELEGNQDPI